MAGRYINGRNIGRQAIGPRQSVEGTTESQPSVHVCVYIRDSLGWAMHWQLAASGDDLGTSGGVAEMVAKSMSQPIIEAPMLKGQGNVVPPKAIIHPNGLEVTDGVSKRSHQSIHNLVNGFRGLLPKIRAVPALAVFLFRLLMNIGSPVGTTR